jgi:VWFA-related protein
MPSVTARVPGLAWLCAVLLAAGSSVTAHALAAQSEAPQSGDVPTIQVKSSAVLVPTLVETRSGSIIYGLKPEDFSLFDNGRPQKLHVDEDLDTEPLSVVVAIETGRTSLLEFDKINRLGSLLDLFLGDGKSEVALVGFDSQPHLVDDFSGNASAIKHAIENLEPGDGGAAILDTVGYAVHLLEQRPESHRRVLLLISETRDHGSHEVRAEDLVKEVGLSNTLVVSLAYVPARAEFLHDLKGSSDGNTYANLMTPLMMAVQAMRKNVAREIALMSGGEYAPFARERSFEDRVATVSRHARNRYLLSFQPADHTAGLHTLEVHLRPEIDGHVVARASYWMQPQDDADDGAHPQPSR